MEGLGSHSCGGLFASHNLNIMKKFISTLIFATLVVPSVAFASWWNPMSWFNNWSFSNTSGIQTQQLEQRITELENKLNENVASSTLTTTNQVSVSSTTKSEVNKSQIIVNKTASKPIIESEHVNATSTNQTNVLVTETRSDLLSKFAVLKINIQNIITTNGLGNSSDPQVATLNQIVQKAQSNIYNINQTNTLTDQEITYYATQYNSLISTFKGLSPMYTTAYNANDSLYNGSQSSSACVSAKQAYTEAYNAYSNAKQALSSQIYSLQTNNPTGQSGVSVQNEINQIQTQGNANLAILASKATTAQNTMNSACYNLAPTFTVPVQTYCQVYNSSGTCISY